MCTIKRNYKFNFTRSLLFTMLIHKQNVICAGNKPCETYERKNFEKKSSLKLDYSKINIKYLIHKERHLMELFFGFHRLLTRQIMQMMPCRRISKSDTTSTASMPCVTHCGHPTTRLNSLFLLQLMFSFPILSFFLSDNISIGIPNCRRMMTNLL